MAQSWLDPIWNILANQPLRPYVLLCPSFAQGHQLLERLANQRGSVWNLRVETIESVMFQMAAIPLESAGITVVSEATLRWLIQGHLREVAPAFATVAATAEWTPGLVQVFQRAIFTLRRFGVESDSLDGTQFVQTEKGLLVKALLERYEQALALRNWGDFATIATYAIQEAQRSQRVTSRQTPVYVLPASVRADGLAGQFLDALNERCEIVRLADGPLDTGANPIIGATDVEFFAAASSLAEVREVFRRALHADFPMDHIEIIASNYEDEALAIYQIAAAKGIPVTFSQGLPVTVTKSGQLVLTLLDWLESNYDVSILLGAIRQGLLRIRDEAISSAQLASRLAEANVGWGRDRYLLLLKRFAQQPDNEHAPVYDRLHGLFSNLFADLPVDARTGWSMLGVLRFLHMCIRTFGPLHSEREARLVSQIEQMVADVGMVDAIAMDRATAIRYVRDWFATLRADVATRPEPGKLHVAGLADGGQTGRSATFVLGTSETNWTINTRQDPILLDEERLRIGHGLLTSGDEMRRVETDRQRLIARLDGRVTFSYSSYQVLDDKPEGPAPMLLSIYQFVTGKVDSDLSELVSAIGDPVGYAGHATQTDFVDAFDVVVAATRGWDGLQAVLQAYPPVASGHLAEAARQSDDLTVYDGVIGEDPRDGQDVWHASPSALETLAGCPRKYFYHYVLSVRVSEETEFDRSRWLSPLERGSLYHAVFEAYMREVTGDGKRRAKHDEARLLAICEAELDTYRALIPAPSEHIAEMECAEIRQSMRKFLAMEQSRGGQPRFFELAFGSNEEPYPVEIGDGLTIPMVGMVDRVDMMGPHTYRVLDYKTGKSSSYDPIRPLRGGRQLQHAIYGLAVEQWLVETGIDPSPHVQDSAYVFPSVRGTEDEVAYAQTPELRQNLRQLVRNLLMIIENGAFVATTDARQCTWCDFAAICTGNASADSQRKREVLENESILKPVLEVESHA